MLLSKATYKNILIFKLYIYCQYVCSLGIEPTTFALLMQCSNYWAKGTLVCDSHRLAKICSEQCLEICITSTPCDCLPLYNVRLIVFLNCKSLWIKASAKWINVNVTFPLSNVIRLKPICFLSQGMLVGLLILQVIIYRSHILAIIFNQRNICVYL